MLRIFLTIILKKCLDLDFLRINIGKFLQESCKNFRMIPSKIPEEIFAEISGVSLEELMEKFLEKFQKDP